MIDALIIGAGPVGLSMAIGLTRQGLNYRIIDMGTGPVPESRAIGIQARTLEMLEMAGVVEPFIEQGHPLRGFILHGPEGRQLGSLSFEHIKSRYPFILALPQNDTERILTEHLRRLGVQVERLTKLLSFRQDQDQVTAQIQRPDGGIEDVTCQWLLGCDGIHSRVREVLALQFPGKTYDLRFILADCHAEMELSDDHAHGFAHRTSLVAIFPLGHARHRLVAADPPACFDWQRKPTLAEWQELVDARASVPIRLSEPKWTTFFRVQCRLVDRLKRGRVFVLGDAAHVHSPALAQGMNTGMQDAWNLGWKLGLVRKGLAKPELLDSFEAERLPVERRVLDITDFTQNVVGATDRFRQAARDLLAPLFTRSVAVQRRISLIVSELGVNYHDSPIVEDHHLPHGPKAGQRAPDAIVAGRDGMPVHLMPLLGRNHVLLTVDADLSSPALKEIAQDYAGIVDVQALTIDAAGTSVYGNTPAFYLIRPDGHVAFRCGAQHPELLRAYLGRMLAVAGVSQLQHA